MMDKRRERGIMGSSRGKVLKAFLGGLVFLVAFWFFFVGIISNHATKTVTITVTTSSAEMLERWKWNGIRDRSTLHWDSNNLIYVSKRRVPNGPDPIHNRRAVKTRQPPGRA